jgi:hypothetical protein
MKIKLWDSCDNCKALDKYEGPPKGFRRAVCRLKYPIRFLSNKKKYMPTQSCSKPKTLIGLSNCLKLVDRRGHEQA